MSFFSEIDKSRIRVHLEYPDITSAALSTGGIIYAGQPQFVLEYALNHTTDNGILNVQKTLNILDAVQTQQVDALGRLRASKADVVVLNANEHAELEKQYLYWQRRLSNQLSVPVNPFRISKPQGVSRKMG